MSPEYCCVAPTVNLNEVPKQVFLHGHRFGHHSLTTAQLAQDVEQLVPILVTRRIVQHLKNASALGGDVIVERHTVSILSISS